MLYESTIKAMVRRFDMVFNTHNLKDEAAAHRDMQVEQVLDHLRRHTKRRRGEVALQEGLVEWENTSRIYELFAVNLNIYERIFFTVDVSESTSILSRICSAFLVVMIIVSIVAWVISTLPSEPFRSIPAGCIGVQIGECAPQPAEAFQVIEQLCVYVFTAEYLVRVCTVHSVRFALLDEEFLVEVLSGREMPRERQGRLSSVSHRSIMQSTSEAFDGMPNRRYQERLDGRIKTLLRHILSPTSLVDLLAIIPYWMEVFSGKLSEGGALLAIRALRLTRIFRVFKLGRYNEVFTLFSRVVDQSLPALSLMLVFVVLDCCLFGALIWFAEQGTWYPEGHQQLLKLNIANRGAYLRKDSQAFDDDDALSETPFISIIHSFWYVIVTITTVGYGDLVPITTLGKVLGTLTILNGVVLLAMPIGVVGANFSTEYYRVLDEKKRRARLKQQNELKMAVEEEQDLALIKDDHGTGEEASSKGESKEATEIQRAAASRERLLADAEDIDRKWQAAFPDDRYQLLSLKFRYLLKDLLVPNGSSSEFGGSMFVKPVVLTTILRELDVLTGLVHSIVSAQLSVEELADFGMSEAKEVRQRWAAFCELCWDYVIDECRVEKPQDPPELFEIKAALVCNSVGRLSSTMKHDEAPFLSPSVTDSADLKLGLAARAVDRPPPAMQASPGSATSDLLESDALKCAMDGELGVHASERSDSSYIKGLLPGEVQ